ncbi:hypothetical protein [Streptomyces brevispora]|uniref:hypothetical protein n=1 Tax=Streptomyces brevispora TaxID=887462 RepID=UPI002DD8086E|nr:hypothetical protein [Streptomyces brevispora]
MTAAQMPAVNTPQFSWVLSRLQRRPQPVPPIYQPEVAAAAVVHAADYPGRRQYVVGTSTMAALLANKIAPGLLDRYLARTGYDSQQAAEVADEGRRTNLWRPVDDDADHGAHGSFDEESRRHDPQLWASRHPALAATLAAGGVSALTALGARVRKRR